MQILTRLNKVIAYSEAGYIPVGNTAICVATNDCYDDALIVDVDCVPTDIDRSDYYYINGRFVKGSPAKVEDMTAEELIDATDFEEGMNEDDVIPKATKDLLGCVVVGDGLDVANGVLSNGRGMELLWQNASPTSNFAAQTINLDLNEYKYVMIECVANSEVTTLYYQKSQICEVGSKGHLEVTIKSSASYVTYYTREYNISTSGITFAGGYAGSATFTLSASNGGAVPLKIYGIKGVS